MKHTEKVVKSPQGKKSKPRLSASKTARAESKSERVRHALANSELRYRRLFETAQDGILILDAETGTITDVNPFLINMLGYSREEFMEKKLWEIGEFKNIAASRDAFEELNKKEYIHYENMQLKAKDGRLVQVEFVSNVYTVGDEKVIQCNIRDVTERKRAEDALRESEETYKTILMASPDDITIADLSGRIIMVSEAANKMFGYDQEEGPGMSVMDFIAPEEHERARVNIARMLSENYPGPNEYRAIRKDRSCFDIEVNNALIRDRQGNPIRMVLIARDITDRKRMQEEILSLSITDKLTGLNNRRGFLSLAEQQLKLSIRHKTGMLFFFADLDDLKWINDTLGHEAGDKALIEAVTVLKESFRASDIIARLGGDEFAALAIELPKENYNVLTDRLQSLIDIRNNHGNRRYKLSISVGYSLYDPENPCSIEDLMASADKLMYEQKQNKRSLFPEGASLSSSIQ